MTAEQERKEKASSYDLGRVGPLPCSECKSTEGRFKELSLPKPRDQRRWGEWGVSGDGKNRQGEKWGSGFFLGGGKSGCQRGSGFSGSRRDREVT